MAVEPRARDRVARPARSSAEGRLVARPRAGHRRGVRSPPSAVPEARVSYDPKGFWEQRLGEHFDLVGTGETGLSLAYNRACYALRARQLERALGRADVTLGGRRVLDVGCGTGFFTDFYLRRGALVTGLDITTASVERLRRRF